MHFYILWEEYIWRYWLTNLIKKESFNSRLDSYLIFQLLGSWVRCEYGIFIFFDKIYLKIREERVYIYVLNKLDVNIAFSYTMRRIYLKIFAYQSHRKEVIYFLLECQIGSSTFWDLDKYERLKLQILFMVAIETKKLMMKKDVYVFYKLDVNIAFLYYLRRIYL